MMARSRIVAETPQSPFKDLYEWSVFIKSASIRVYVQYEILAERSIAACSD